MNNIEYISETIHKICDKIGLIAYECFDLDAAIIKFKIEDQHGNVIDTIKIDRYSFDKCKLDEAFDKLLKYDAK